MQQYPGTVVYNGVTWIYNHNSATSDIDTYILNKY